MRVYWDIYGTCKYYLKNISLGYTVLVDSVTRQIYGILLSLGYTVLVDGVTRQMVSFCRGLYIPGINVYSILIKSMTKRTKNFIFFTKTLIS